MTTESTTQATLTTRELLAKLQICRTTLRRLIQRGRFPQPIKLTQRTLRWPAAAVADWLESHHRPKAADGSVE